MSVFQPTTADYPVFGNLRYGSAYWEGTIDLDAFGGPFQVIVRAGRDGPLKAQIAAMSRIVSDAAPIKKSASPEMVDIHEESGLLPPDTGIDADQVWRYLRPSQIDVSDESYYADGRIAILIIFESTQYASFAPAIETADGQFVQVLSGT